jgi:translation initiation factor eIF-2B subunit alpha
MEQKLLENNIPFCLVTDSAIGFVMQKVDFVLVGADCITRNGGILNDIGTLPMAIVSKQLNKPFYCIAESYKFTDIYPLSQDDLGLKELDFDGKMITESRDYTPPEFVSMIFSNEGPLTPSGVAELFLKMAKGI